MAVDVNLGPPVRLGRCAACSSSGTWSWPSPAHPCARTTWRQTAAVLRGSVLPTPPSSPVTQIHSHTELVRRTEGEGTNRSVKATSGRSAVERSCSSHRSGGQARRRHTPGVHQSCASPTACRPLRYLLAGIGARAREGRRRAHGGQWIPKPRDQRCLRRDRVARDGPSSRPERLGDPQVGPSSPDKEERDRALHLRDAWLAERVGVVVPGLMAREVGNIVGAGSESLRRTDGRVAGATGSRSCRCRGGIGWLALMHASAVRRSSGEGGRMRPASSS